VATGCVLCSGDAPIGTTLASIALYPLDTGIAACSRPSAADNTHKRVINVNGCYLGIEMCLSIRHKVVFDVGGTGPIISRQTHEVRTSLRRIL